MTLPLDISETYRIGRGVLSALGVDFELQEGDIAARANFATVDESGKVRDCRAGRIATNLNQGLCKKICHQVKLNDNLEFFFETVSEHRAVLVLRGAELSGELPDTDPQRTGVKPKSLQTHSDAAQKTARIIDTFLDRVRETLAGEAPANMVLLRGFEQYHPLPSLRDRFQLQR